MRIRLIKLLPDQLWVQLPGTANINLTPDAAGYYFEVQRLVLFAPWIPQSLLPRFAKRIPSPSDTKQVKDSGEATETWEETDDAQIGDTVNFKLTVTDGKGTDRAIVLHDVMSDGLTLDISSFSVNGPSITADDYKIYVSSALTTTGTKPGSIDQSINIAATDITDGAATNPKTLHAKDNDSFVIIFEAGYVSKLEENAEITVTYSAILNDNAVVGTAEKNVSHITYSNQTTQNKEVEVNTYDVDILKYAREDSNKKAIAGAVFQLQDKDGNALWLNKRNGCCWLRCV